MPGSLRHLTGAHLSAVREKGNHRVSRHILLASARRSLRVSRNQISSIGMIARTLGWRLLTALALGGALVSFAMACGDDAAVTASPDGSPPDASTLDGGLPIDADVDAFCKGTLGLYAPRYAECCDPSAAPKLYCVRRKAPEGTSPRLQDFVGEERREWARRAHYVGGGVVRDGGEQRDPGTNVSRRPALVEQPDRRGRSSTWKGSAPKWSPVIKASTHRAPTTTSASRGSRASAGHRRATAPARRRPERARLVATRSPTEEASWSWCAGASAPIRVAPPASTVLRPHSNKAPASLRSSRKVPTIRTTSAPRGSGASWACAEPPDPYPPTLLANETPIAKNRLYCKSADGGSLCAPREVAGTPCSNEFGSECQGACVKPDAGTASCVAFCGSQ